MTALTAARDTAGMISPVQVYRQAGLAALVLCLAGCGCRNEAPRAMPPVLVQTPTSPVARVQTPTAPLPQTPTTPRQVQTPTAPPPLIAPPRVLGLEAMRLVKEGMTNKEVGELLGRPGFVMSQTGDETVLYRWTDPDSATLLARFENGKLTRKNVIAANGVELDENKSLSEEDYHAITPGMSLEEALTQIGVEPKSQNTGRDGASILRWADKYGSSFTARFQDGKLVRKTGFHVARKPKSESMESQEQEAPVTAPEEPAEQDEASSTPTETTKSASESADDEPTAPEKRPRVRSTGSADRGGQKAGSYNPKAKLPEFAHGLRLGAFEVRVTNPTDSKVRAGLRTGNRGVDVTVPPRSSRSMKVDRGVYSFYFISDADPYTLNGGGGGVDLTSMFASDIEISIIDENFEVRLLNGAP